MGAHRNGRHSRQQIASINADINRYLSRQEGRISFDQLKAAGLDWRAIKRRRGNGQLILDTYRAAGWGNSTAGAGGTSATKTDEMVEGVYRVPGASTAFLGLCWRGVLSAPGQGYLDHVSALQIAGVESYDSSTIHVVTHGGGWEPPAGVESHRTRTLPARDRTTWLGVPAVSVPRALLTAAPSIDRVRLDDLLDTAVRQGRYDGEAVVETVERFQTVPGYPPLIAAIAALDATSGTFRSIFERRTMRLVERSSKLPPAVVNELLEGYLPDFRFVGTRAIIECDGRDYHRSPAQVIADAKRQEILEALGFRFLRLRWAQVVYEEEATLARIEAFVLANLEAPVPGL